MNRHDKWDLLAALAYRPGCKCYWCAKREKDA